MFNKRQTHEKMHRNFVATDIDNDNDAQYEHDQFPEYERKHRTVTIPLHGSGEMYGYFDEEDGNVVVINDENDDLEENSESSTHWGVDVYHPKKGCRINPELFNGSRIRLRRGLFNAIFVKFQM